MMTIDNTHRIIFVNIKNSYEAWLNNDRSNPLYRPSVYDCTVKYWQINYEKANKATHIIGCYKGIVKEVVKITEQPRIDTEVYPGRMGLSGIEEPDSPYMGLDIRNIFNSIANFRVRYYNL